MFCKYDHMVSKYGKICVVDFFYCRMIGSCGNFEWSRLVFMPAEFVVEKIVLSGFYEICTYRYELQITFMNGMLL